MIQKGGFLSSPSHPSTVLLLLLLVGDFGDDASALPLPSSERPAPPPYLVLKEWTRPYHPARNKSLWPRIVCSLREFLFRGANALESTRKRAQPLSCFARFPSSGTFASMHALFCRRLASDRSLLRRFVPEEWARPNHLARNGSLWPRINRLLREFLF